MRFRPQKTLDLKTLLCTIALAGCAPAAVAPVKPPENYDGPIAEAPSSQPGDSWTYERPDGNKFKVGRSSLAQNKMVNFPLWVGKQWSYEFESTTVLNYPKKDRAPIRDQLDCQVMSSRIVEVKAGAFEAFECKCVCEVVGRPLIYSEYCGTVTVWYAPAVKNIVRVKTDSTSNTYDLAEYRFSKRGIEPTSYEPRTADDFVDQGDTYFDRKDYDHAIESYNRALQLDPNCAIAFFNRARAYGEKRVYDLAIQNYTHYIELDPKSAAAFNNRGNMYRDRKEYERALEDYERAIQLNAKYALPFYNRGILHRERKEYDQAIADLDQAIRLNSRYDIAFNARGNVYRDKKEYDRAIQDYNEAVRITPTYAAAFNNRASAYRNNRSMNVPSPTMNPPPGSIPWWRNIG